MSKSAIVVITGPTGTFYHGPFTNGEQACSWAYNNVDKSHTWHWEEMSRPGSTYQTCSVDDAMDLIAENCDEDGNTYVTIAGVNWAVDRNM